MERSRAVEDERGVDVSQIRARLAMSVPERVRTMVESVNRVIAMRESAQSVPGDSA